MFDIGEAWVWLVARRREARFNVWKSFMVIDTVYGVLLRAGSGG